MQVRAWLSEVEVANAIHHRNLTIFPLLWKGGTDDSISGSTLYNEGAVCHLSAFQAADALSRPPD